MKHTSWFIDPKAETHVISKDRAICSISFFDGDPKTREENKSIANLISAAPDLLEAVERSQQYLIWAIHDSKEQGIHQDTINIAERDLKMVKAAIAKARQQPGEQS